jgi:hypothetical protein
MIDDDYCTEVDGYIERLNRCDYIMEKEVKKLCEKAKEILSMDENVIYLSSPITVKKY